MKTLKELLDYGGKYYYFSLLSLLFSAMSALFSLFVFIYIFKILQEMIIVYPDFLKANHVIQNGWLSFLMAVLGIIFYILSLLCSHLSAFRIADNMRKKAMHHVMTLPLGYVESRGSGEIRKIIDEASSSTENYLAHQLPDYIQVVTSILAILVLLFFYDWRFGICSLIPIGLSFLQMFKMVGPGLEGSMKNYQDALNAMSNEAVEYIRGIQVVKTFQQTIYSFNRFHKTIKDYEKFALDYTEKMKLPMVRMTLFINSIFAFLILLALIFQTCHYDPKGYVADFLFYCLFTPILAINANKMLYVGEVNMLAINALKTIHSIIDQQPFSYQDNTTVLHSYHIEFKDVSFHYPDSEELVLKNINLSISEGSTIALVGSSGSGKSTLVSLLSRFYDVSDGSILIDHINVKDLTEKELMSKISFVFQDSHLLKKSIYDNITMGKQVSKEQVLEVIKMVNLDKVINRLPDGIDTIVGDNGIYLSGGEKQRLMIARAIIKDAPIILLDEPTAYGDSDNEILIQQALNKLLVGKTTIIIAHRLSTIKNVDNIYVLDKGSIVESGQHETLIKQDGLYSKMWRDYLQSVEWKVQGGNHHDK